ncbi:MAG: hypothetical protein ABJO36_11565 [Litorimonas sp.]
MNPLKLRRFLILVHLYLASILAPIFILVAITGGNYLLNNKGETETTPIILPAGAVLDFKSPSLEEDIRQILSKTDTDIKFEYIRSRGNSAMTRPTSRPYVQFDQTPEGLKASLKIPNLQYKLMELHKGHGPTLFKKYQILAAFSLFLVVFGGLVVGVLAKNYRRPTILALVAGSILFIILAFFT